MSPLTVLSDTSERVSRTKVVGLIVALLGALRAAEAMFGFQIIPAGTEDKIGPFVDSAFAILGVLTIVFRGKKG